MVCLKAVCNQYNQKDRICDYLHWYEIMPLLLLNDEFNKMIDHPFIKQAMYYYKIKDGVRLKKSEAKDILSKTKNLLGTELVETAILSNLKFLQNFKKLSFKETENAIYDYNYSCNDIKKVDIEINNAIIWSRCSLYEMLHIQKTQSPGFSMIEYNENIVSYEYEYNINVISGKYLNQDHQINLIVNKTNMPLSYSYIFLTRFLKQRKRQHYEVLCF